MLTVTYQATQFLSCAKCNGDVILCVSDTLTANGMPFIEATVASYVESWDACGKLNYLYGFSYDEALLLNPGTPLVSTDIEGVFCKGCLTTYIENMPKILSQLDWPGGLDKSVLFIHPAGTVAQDNPSFNYDVTANLLTLNTDIVLDKLNRGFLINPGSVNSPHNLHPDLLAYASPGHTHPPLFTIYGDANSQTQFFICQPGNTNVNALQLVFKGRTGDGSASTCLQANDNIFRLLCYGSDGVAYQESVCLAAVIDDLAPGLNSMPGRLQIEIAEPGYWAAYVRWWFNHKGEFVQGPIQGGLTYCGRSIVSGNRSGVFTLGAGSAAVFGIPGYYGVSQTAGQEQIVLIGSEANPIGGTQTFAKTRTTYSDAPTTIVADSDILGRISGYGADGNTYQAAAYFQLEVDGTPAAASMPGRISFYTTPSSSVTPVIRWKIDSHGHLKQVLGASTDGGVLIRADSIDSDITGGVSAFSPFYALVNGNTDEGLVLVGVSNNAIGGTVALLHTRSAAADANTIVQNGDILGRITGYGADGTQYQAAARIQIECDGAPFAASMPGRIVFMTTPLASTTPLDRWIILATGDLICDGTTGGDLDFRCSGRGIKIAEGGGNAKMGTLTLNGAAAVPVATTIITANSRIFMTAQDPNGGTPHHFWVSSIAAGVGFTVTGEAGDTSIVAWEIIEPS